MPKILWEDYDKRTFLDEHQLVEYGDDTHSVACTLYDDCERPEKPPWELTKTCSANELSQ